MRISDGSSDVCSSDLGNVVGLRRCLFRGSCRQRCSSTGAHHQNGVENRCAQRIVHVASPSGCVFRRSHHTPRRDGIGSSTTGGGCAPLPVQRDQRPSATVQNDFPFGHAFGTHRQYGLQCLQQRSLVAVVEHTTHAQVVERGHAYVALGGTVAVGLVLQFL